MSVYSGFGTRLQETKYNTLVENLLLGLKKRLIKFYKGQLADEDKFKLLIKKLIKKMVSMEKAKFLQPKFSTGFEDLISLLQIQINYDSDSDMSSVYSGSISIDKKGHNKQEFLKSRNMLQTKKATIQSALRAEKTKQSNQYQFKNLTQLDIADEDVITSFNKHPQYRSVTLDVLANKARKEVTSRGRLILKDLKVIKQIRPTIPAPPKLQDFIPKKEAFFKEDGQFTPLRTQARETRDHPRSFRKQKFSLVEAHLSQI